jgi:hypothetical protein
MLWPTKSNIPAHKLNVLVHKLDVPAREGTNGTTKGW